MEKKPLIGICLCMLLMISTIIPVEGTPSSEKTSQPLKRGKILYVGRAGLNNYTTIQDAIDNATEGDTVFVYDDSSPYLENLAITTSISLVGEEKNTTIIDGAQKANCMNITADNVTIVRFTIQNGNHSGIFISSNHNIITENILKDNVFGINTGFGEPFESFQNNTISKNHIVGNGVAIVFFGGKNIIITGNKISHSEEGIFVAGVLNGNISWNIISENEIGLFTLITYNTVIYRNNISSNQNIGLFTTCMTAGKILQNNFIGNNESAMSTQRFPPMIKMWKKYNLPAFRRNIWKGNYWDEPRLFPYMIPGVWLKLRFHFDWHPAKEPYDIPAFV